MLIYFPALIGLATLAAIAVFLWNRLGPKSGRKLGNQIAEYIGIRRSLFYSLLDHGAEDSSRTVLKEMQKSELGVETATLELAPILVRGVGRLEAHFGEQVMVNDAKPKIRRFLSVTVQGDRASQPGQGDA